MEGEGREISGDNHDVIPVLEKTGRGGESDAFIAASNEDFRHRFSLPHPTRELIPRTTPAWLQWQPYVPRTLINCLNTGSQKARKCRGMCSENVEHFLYVAQSMGQTPQCLPKKHVDMLSKVPTN